MKLSTSCVFPNTMLAAAVVGAVVVAGAIAQTCYVNTGTLCCIVANPGPCYMGCRFCPIGTEGTPCDDLVVTDPTIVHVLQQSSGYKDLSVGPEQFCQWYNRYCVGDVCKTSSIINTSSCMPSQVAEQQSCP